MELRSEHSGGILYLSLVFYIFNKYAWVVFLKGRKDIKITSAFQKVRQI